MERSHNQFDASKILGSHLRPSILEANQTEIRIRDLAFNWPGESHTLSKISFSAFAGDTISIVGRNGSGKSTLLYLLAGLLQPDSGDITFGQSSHTTLNWRQIKERMRFVRTRVTQFSFHDEPLLTAIIASAVKAGIHFSQAEEIAHLLAENFDLKNVLHKSHNELSTGYQQRASLARAFAAKPRIVLLDEPFENLDAISREYIAQTLKALKAKEDLMRHWGDTTIFIATQDLSIAEYTSDQIIVLEGGRPIWQGHKSEMKVDNGLFYLLSFKVSEEVTVESFARLHLISQPKQIGRFWFIHSESELSLADVVGALETRGHQVLECRDVSTNPFPHIFQVWRRAK